ncbi:ras-like protein family member 12 [Saccoglossus kowalevskii]|uniref:small monomeric GTPase n=1 Tax=Saccoglossus kowalevskii TaxID=10224 RepID=A0ABM0GLV4_SACKO|nr:PREDICTED: ras-like protein family member 12-like [Saccoglossus kowalevskii]
MSSKQRTRGGSTGASGMILPEFKIALLGSLGVGKSALTVKFITRRFINEYDPNLEDTYSKEAVVDNQQVLIKIMDTANHVAESWIGSEDECGADRYLNWADSFIVVYSIDNRHSFDTAKTFLQEVSDYQKLNSPEKPILLLGNKVDISRYRQVSKSEGNVLSQQYACKFYETSAAGNYESVEKVFLDAVREIRDEAERHKPLKPLFISDEDKPVTQTKETKLKLAKPKPLHPKKGSTFRIFNKIFN